MLKEAVETTGAHSTQEGQTLLDELHPLLAQRAKEWQEIADEMWTHSGVYVGMADQYQDDNWLHPG